MELRNHGHDSPMPGTKAPAHHTAWVDALDDSLESYLQTNNTSNKQGRDRQNKNPKSTWLILIAKSIATNMIFWFSVGYFKYANDGPKCSIGVGDGSKLEIFWKKVVIKIDFANMKNNSSIEKSFGTILVQDAIVMGGCIYPVQNTLTGRL